MLILTGSAGFIGSQLAKRLGDNHRLLLVDSPEAFRKNHYFGVPQLSDWDRAKALSPSSPHTIVDHTYFPQILQKAQKSSTKATQNLIPEGEEIQALFHIGAITDTSRERDMEEMRQWNTEYSKLLWQWCAREGVPFLYASSAATYGLGEFGFSDDHKLVSQLQPLNPYAISKQEFDQWVLEQVKTKQATPPCWYGVKFFNVFGPHESHKGSMASTIYHSYQSIQKTNACPLFRSHKEGISDGEQQRDFIFVQDVVNVMEFLHTKQPPSGIYNCGSGKARTFYSMVESLFACLKKELQVKWIDTPTQYRESYQYYTQAEMTKLKNAGYNQTFLSLEEGIEQYVTWLEGKKIS